MSISGFSVHPSAMVDEPCVIGEGTRIWHFSHVMKNARLGRNCILGQNVFVAEGVIMGDNCKIQNNVSLYTGVELEDDVFLGPSCVLTNVTNPRCQVVRHDLYEKTLLRRGASVGANATLVCGITVGRYAFIGAGAVVVADVPDYALMLGVPARQNGWMSRHGLPLPPADADGMMTCPESGLTYEEIQPGLVRCREVGEDDPLPESLSKASGRYDDFK